MTFRKEIIFYQSRRIEMNRVLMKYRGMRPAGQQGFTLAEILIAVFILSMVMAVILGTFTGVISSSREAETRSELYQTGRALMDLITTDIRCLFPQETEAGTHYFRGETVSLRGTDVSGMSFVTTNALTMGKAHAPYLSAVTYRLVDDPDGPGSILLRRAESPATPPFDEGGREVPICRIVEKFHLEFMSEGAIRKDLIDILPEAVKVELVLNLEGHRETFLTMVRPMVTVKEGG